MTPPSRLAWAAVIALGSMVTPATGSEGKWTPGNPVHSDLPGEVGDADDRSSASGVHGRFDGDLDLAVAAGAEVAPGSILGSARVQAHYYSMAGCYLGYRHGSVDDPDPGNVASVGVDLRPLFLPRWALDLERGPVWLDLMLGSVSVSAGAWLALEKDDAVRPEQRGLELSFGAGVPLLGEASGPWLEARYLRRFAGSGEADDGVWLLVSWHFLLSTPLADTTGAIE